VSARLKSGERVAKGIRKLTREEIAAIITHLKGWRREDRGASLHAARKSLKKVRAVLRLVRRRFDPDTYREENRNLREVGRALAPQRDAEVLIKTLASLRRPVDGADGNAAVARLERVLRDRRRKAFASQDKPRALRPVLKTAQRHASRWPVQKLDWGDLCNGLGRTYRQGREAFKALSRRRTDDGLHEWRKRVKDLSYQLRVIQSACPKAIAKLGKEVKRLGDHLGDDHDLAMLEEAVRTAPMEPVEAQKLLRRIAARRRHLQSAGFDLGRLVYADKPARFASQIKRLWKPGK
jgi:CHAD domain-containing protein